MIIFSSSRIHLESLIKEIELLNNYFDFSRSSFYSKHHPGKSASLS